MDKTKKEHRDRLVTLSLVSVLLILLYGPAAPLFVSVDRFLFDQFASHVRNEPLADGLIVSINPARRTLPEIHDRYGEIIGTLKSAKVRRIILTEPPETDVAGELPGWAATLSAGTPVFVPTGNRFADVATKRGVFTLQPDNDQVLRSSTMWHLQGGIMTPSLPLAIALDDPSFSPDPRVSNADILLFMTNYEPVPHITAAQFLGADFDRSTLEGRTVFVDTSPALAGASAILPSGQPVTRSEVVAALLSNIEQHQSVIGPAWVKALELMIPALLSILAILFLPGRSRREIVVFAAVALVSLLLLDALLLLIGRVRLDIGRALIIFACAAALIWWLAGTVSKARVNALKRGHDFLTAGRLEPAFAEFRNCEPSETVATAMYKLSLAFEEQAKPERAEAVLEWMKRTQGSVQNSNKLVAQNGEGGAPQRLGRYVIERKIGRGAMGAVYLARDPRINRAIALKVIPIEKEFEDEELAEARQRFFREAESAGRLTHPNIITVFDAGEDKHLAYIAMEYLPGVPLTTFTDPKKLLAPRKALELCARTAEALDYAHNQGVIHRDIKPANLLYNRKDDTLKISDFGVARLTDNNRTKTGIVLGTPMYMSPEQLNAEPLTGHSDLFSLGVTLYELLTGEVPFKATNIAVLMTKITTDDPVPVSNRRAGIPPSVDAVLFKAMAKRPTNRFVNGGEMAAALRNCAKYAST
ncbi:MAG: protein kinase [Gammaproteobacteria bacterium]|nr:protein kinase [Gammaproteobacteria bacterium]MDH4316067.1 protein kinase [Gammaproteobacteria bacterium]MDH5215096.1 protein kinase [Gammaproteobacteria bacterium]